MAQQEQCEAKQADAGRFGDDGISSGNAVDP